MKLLVLSNGHGEDTIAVKIIKELQLIEPEMVIASLPLVGEGFAYTQANIPIIAPVKQMPSGGFVYMDKKQLWGDMKQGLIQLTIAQYQAIKKWAKGGGKILAVGDILPCVFAWLSGAEFSFVPTAKSEYFWKDEGGWLPHTNGLDRFFGSVFYPWERWLMSHSRCRGVFPRDTITAHSLAQRHINALDVGNPMMDGIADHHFNLEFDPYENHLKIVLLPGSRMPEALDNWQLILRAVDCLLESMDYQFLFLGAIAPSLPLEPFIESLNSSWRLRKTQQKPLPIRDQKIVNFQAKQGTLIISQSAYADCLHYGDMAIAMAGTATEQFIGLGKSAITIIGKGPQFNRQFAQNQSYLLGDSINVLEKPEEIVNKIKKTLENPDYWQLVAENGKKRMGNQGASRKIAHHLINQLM
ncbi:hypothetical protein IQ215_03075 [Cyanobacterium stanieri LEGE 03274]|uniref:Lipid-A-disaccharide synthase n=1 Tax=Cyanobacterium stanieri LEGE 03274 TaxID=1828756 RepID=A0ABR9V199_9CHRO|nr:lipid-A-disaccharide synthase-related protein [Cyanobacterium stanieri]MBE9221670.1 hypothetical protein [Cyanobacterium stanieri LEGE 03274]